MPNQINPEEVGQGYANKMKKQQASELPNSDIFSNSFWRRAFAIFGHLLAVQLVIWAFIMLIGILASAS